MPGAGADPTLEAMDVNDARRMAATLGTGAARFVAGATNPPGPRHRLLRRGRYDLVEIADVITALICFLVSDAGLRNVDTLYRAHQPNGTLALVALVTSAPLVLRTRAPLTAWAASALAILGTAVVFARGPLGPAAPYLPSSLLVYWLCLYAVTIRCAPRIVASAAGGTVLAALIIQPRTAPAALFLTVIPVLLGTVVRTRRSGTRQLAEQERRHSGERARLEERQRIARELHDVVAHHMSVIAIQAEAAPYKTADPPPELVESFGEIRQSALTGLTELRRLLGVLRTGGPATAPQPGLSGLDALLDSARGGGVSVTLSVIGDRFPLPDGVDLSAYRIVQEALSNAMRHAPGSQVCVRVAYSGDSLDLEVRNDAVAEAGRAGTDDGGEHGIVGMRERAAMLGGTLFAGPVAGGGFRVAATLPVHRDPAGELT